MQKSKIKISYDYLGAALMCTAVIMCGDSRVFAAVVCMVCHELGHIALMLCFGSEEITIKINMFSAAICDSQRGVRPYRQDFIIILAGPCVNIIMAVVLGRAYTAFEYDLLYNASAASLVLGIFNLVPIRTTDGGQLLEIALNRILSPYTVDKIMKYITLVLAVPLVLLGGYVLAVSEYNYTLILSVAYLLIEVILKD